ncbi:epoxide hydrolase N-terminal domain-containing protein [Rhizobium leguminosarum]|nr:epoxide hydrolase N-terminal domain-containing protein [Rhizobium leguminosarum]
MALPNSLKHRDISRRSLLLGLPRPAYPPLSFHACPPPQMSSSPHPGRSDRSRLRSPRRRLQTSGGVSPRPAGPTGETVRDRSQGVQTDRLKELARYWQSSYDWRKAENRLNSFPQFLTNIDGLDIHFIHVRSHHENALPLIMTHGWPGSVFRAA